MILGIFVAVSTIATGAPSSAYDYADIGFKAYQAQDYETAVAAFDQALALNNRLGNVAAQRAYALKKLGRNKQAISSFERARDLDAGENDDLYRREIALLSNEFNLSFYTAYREAATRSDFLAVTGPSLTQSQSALEGIWTPPSFGYRDGRLIQAFGRVIWGYEGNNFTLDSQSFQSGIGIRFKPLARTNLIFSAERLVALGDNARDDWMLRASYSWDQGYGFNPQEKQWRYLTFYGDIAVIDPKSPDIFLASEIRVGESFRVGSAMSLTPHMMLNSVYQKDDYHTIRIIEGGPGVSLKYYSEPSTIEVLIQYRQKLAGNSPDASGFIFTFVTGF